MVCLSFDRQSICSNRGVFLSVCLFIFRSVRWVCLCVRPFVYRSVHSSSVCLFFCRSVCSSAGLSVHLPVCLFVCQSICLSDSLSVRMSVHLFFCLFVYPTLSLVSLAMSVCPCVCLCNTIMPNE